jgi:signal transduction histidine kinase
MKTRRSVVRFALSIVASVPILMLLQLFVLKGLPDSSFFMPHVHCYLDNPTMVILQGGSDLFIGLSYVVISVTLGYLVHKASRDIPFQWVLLAFGLFIIACGGTHFMEVITLWHPLYWLSGSVKLVTAVASVATAFVLPPIVPKVLDLLRAARLSEERKRELETLYERLKESDELKTRFFANVSHELRTPLTLILGPARKMLAADHLDPRIRRDLQVVERNAQVLLKHINDMLDISRLDAGGMALHKEPVDIAALLRVSASHFELLAAERAITLRMDAPDHLVVPLDAGKIERVLLNLLSNAFKFVPDGGVVRCGLEVAGGVARITVADSGPGVPAALRESIFERFRQVDDGITRRFGGTGLGLSIVREFAGLHDGAVTVGDATEGGALFTVELPIAPAVTSETGSAARGREHRNGSTGRTPEHAIAEHAIAEQAVAEHRTIASTPLEQDGKEEKSTVLVVEDNLDMNRFISEVLARDYRVANAFNGEEGYRSALELRPDLIVSDVMMPEMSGGQLVRRLREHREMDGTPIILLTAKADDDLLTGLLGNGAQDYLTKPFTAQGLRARVANLVAMKRVRDLLSEALESTSESVTALAAMLAARNVELRVAKDLAEGANRAKDQFLAILSHELRTPLTPVMVAIYELAKDPGIAPENRDLLEVIRRNIDVEVRLIDDLLDLTRLASGKLLFDPTPIDFHTAVRSALEVCGEDFAAKGVDLTVDLAAIEHIGIGDQGRLGQVFWNLLKNAVKFTPAGGSVSLTSSNPAPGRMAVTVADTGIGIEPDVLTKIFTPFEQGEQTVTRRFGGLGLGLAISKIIVDLHDGTIAASSGGKDLGAAFTVELEVGV